MSLFESQGKRIKAALKPGDETRLLGTEAWMIKRGIDIFKLRPCKGDEPSLDIHAELLKEGFDIPKILAVYKIGKETYKEIEWWEGLTFRELINTKQIHPKHYEMLGEFVAKVNNAGFGFINYLPKNLFLSVDGNAINIDLHKLTKSVFPENAIIRYILTEDLVGDKELTFALRAGFLKGYRRYREFDMIKVLKKQFTYCYEGKEVLYADLDVVEEIPRYHIAPPGKQVLEMVTGTGARALKAMLAGAGYVYSCDIYHQRHGEEIFKASDLGKFLAYIHGFDGRDLHYKWITLDSDRFMDHLANTGRKWDTIYLNDVLDKISTERVNKLSWVIQEKWANAKVVK